MSKDELALYKLIWQRFVASQMMPALVDQTTIDITAGPRYLFRATGSVIKFNGFLAVYEEGKDEKDEEDDEQSRKLPLVEGGERLTLNDLKDEQHFTEPPPRYTEATLVKALEEKPAPEYIAEGTTSRDYYHSHRINVTLRPKA